MFAKAPTETVRVLNKGVFQCCSAFLLVVACSSHYLLLFADFVLCVRSSVGGVSCLGIASAHAYMLWLGRFVIEQSSRIREPRGIGKRCRSIRLPLGRGSSEPTGVP